MITFRRRRIIGISAALVLATLFFVAYRKLNDNLVNTANCSGLLLFGFILFLAAYNGRKRITFLPLGSSATWLQFHLYAGYLCIGLFLLHVGFRTPHGGLEILLAILFGLVAGSGIIGSVLSRMIPRRLTQRTGTIIFETIPLLRRELKESVDALVLNSIELTGKSTVADFYAYRLTRFFIGPCNFWSHVRGSERHLHQTYANLTGLKRYLSPAELDVLEKLADKVREKDNLDFQYSLQLLLKYWLFIHIPLTFSLIIIGLFHGIYASLWT